MERVSHPKAVTPCIVRNFHGGGGKVELETKGNDMEQGKKTPLVYRSRQPDNLEGPPEVFDATTTPVEAFFIRSHFDVPKLNGETWSLELEGAVDDGLELGLDELQDFSTVTVRATIECAGNSRTRLGDRAQGVPWKERAIGTADWRGIALAEILDEVGVDADVKELIFVGADRGVVETADGGRIKMPYARSLPREKAMSDEVLIATHMNGEPLTPGHGYPARLVVPGWYGMASVKWLSRIIATTERFDGYFQSEDYAVWDRVHDLVVRRPLGPMAVKSHIGSPVEGQEIRAGDEVMIRGFAWGGTAAIEAVEVSVDGGDSYDQAALADTTHPFAWRSWEYVWEVAGEPGPCLLQSRARTADGASQPERHNWRRGAYAVNAVHPVEVMVV